MLLFMQLYKMITMTLKSFKSFSSYLTLLLKHFLMNGNHFIKLKMMLVKRIYLPRAKNRNNGSLFC
jgi:hypothetical protein